MIQESLFTSENDKFNQLIDVLINIKRSLNWIDDSLDLLERNIYMIRMKYYPESCRHKLVKKSEQDF